MKLLMISGDRALAEGKRGAFFNTLEELHSHFERIDVICPKVSVQRYGMVLFGNVHIHPSKWPMILQWLWVWLQGFRVCKEQHPDLMTVHEYPPFYNGIGARLLHWTTGIPYVLEVHGHQVMLRWNDPKGMLYGLLERLFYRWDARAASVVRVVNGGQASAYLARIGVPSSKVRVVPSVYLDHDVFKPQNAPKEFDCIFVGSLLRNKNPEFFLDVLRTCGFRGLIVGDGPLRRRLERKARRERIRVKFAGAVATHADVAAHIAQARLLIVASFNEGGPRVIAEALTCGVPVVSTPVGIAQDLLPPECIEEYDVVAFADKVKNILEHPDLYARVREAGLFATAHMNRASAIDAYVRMLESVLRPS